MIEVLYEDNHLLVVKKPQNVPVQGDSSKDEDMLTMVKAYLVEKYNKPGEAYVGLVHRLDRPTGGVMVFAKTSKCASRLSKQIREKSFTKEYLAVVENTPREKNEILVNFLKKDERNNKVAIVPSLETGAKRAEMSYKILETYNKKISLVEAVLVTGRSHQIRAQMSNIGCPVVGDLKYNAKNLVSKPNLALWAYHLEFEHPVTHSTMKFFALPPEEDVPWKYFSLGKYVR